VGSKDGLNGGNVPWPSLSLKCHIPVAVFIETMDYMDSSSYGSSNLMPKTMGMIQGK